MYKTIDQYEFANIFEQSDTYRAKFTRPALMALYDYLEELSGDDIGRGLGDSYVFDMVAIACEFSEYKTAWEAMEQYQPEDMPTVENSEGMDLVEIQEASEQLAREWLEERTTVISFDGGIIIANF